MFLHGNLLGCVCVCVYRVLRYIEGLIPTKYCIRLMKEGSVPITLISRVQYNVMNSIRSNFLKTKCDKSGETTLFLTDETKANDIRPHGLLLEGD